MQSGYNYVNAPARGSSPGWFLEGRKIPGCPFFRALYCFRMVRFVCFFAYFEPRLFLCLFVYKMGVEMALSRPKHKIQFSRTINYKLLAPALQALAKTLWLPTPSCPHPASHHPFLPDSEPNLPSSSHLPSSVPTGPLHSPSSICVVSTQPSRSVSTACLQKALLRLPG